MAVLSDLPNEVVDLFLQYLHPRDLEGFLATSKLLRTKYAWLLVEHYNLKQRYSTLKCCPHMNQCAPRDWLNAFLNRPQTAKYVVKLDMEEWEVSSLHSLYSLISLFRLFAQQRFNPLTL